MKLRSIPPIHDINESLKAMRISIDECKERTARMRAKKDCFVKTSSSSFHDNKDEDLKVIDVSPIKSLFCNMNLDNDGTEYDPPLPRRRSKNSEFLDLDAKFDKSGIEETKTLVLINRLFWISRNLIMKIVLRLIVFPCCNPC